MFSKFLGKKNLENNEINKKLMMKIDDMNLTDMRAYINNKIDGLESTEDGIILVLKKLILEDEKTSKRYIEIDNTETKLKKAFELILTILKHKKITIVAIELIQQFLKIYAPIILKYDTDNKQIYGLKMKKALLKTVSSMEKAIEFERKMNLLSE